MLDGMPVSCSMIHGGSTVAVPPGFPDFLEEEGQALTALDTPSCAGLFGMGPSGSPASLLSDVQVLFQSLPGNALGQEFDPNDAGNPLSGQYVIILNPSSPTFSQGTTAANVIIHELLHVAVGMGYSVNSAWTNIDGGSALAERTNNDLIVNNCGVGMLWP